MEEIDCKYEFQTHIILSKLIIIMKSAFLEGLQSFK
jgi:hypothetical protein